MTPGGRASLCGWGTLGAMPGMSACRWVATPARTAHAPRIGIPRKAGRTQANPEDAVVLAKGAAACPKLGVGAWSWGNNTYWNSTWDAEAESKVAEAVGVAMDAGVTMFDTAEAYDFPQGKESSEAILKRALGDRSSDAFVVTKFAPSPLKVTSQAVVDACKKSCDRLGRDSVELYLQHWPGIWANSAYIDGLASCVEQGLAKSVGVSNFNAKRLREAHEALGSRGVPLAANQVQYSLVYTRPLDSGLLDVCRELDVALMAWSPIGQGLLTGRYSEENPPPGIRGSAFGPILPGLPPLLAALDKVGAAHGGKSKAQVALRWLMDQDGVIAIPGAKNASQVEDMVGALGWSMTPEEVDALTTAARELKDRVRSKGGLPALANRLLEAGGV